MARMNFDNGPFFSAVLNSFSGALITSSKRRNTSAIFAASVA
jgi:hypothetical protein